MQFLLKFKFQMSNVYLYKLFWNVSNFSEFRAEFTTIKKDKNQQILLFKNSHFTSTIICKHQTEK